MKMGSWLLPKGAEESVFKPVPGGWALGASAWGFRASRSYFVTDAQKPAIAAKIRRKLSFNVVAAMVAVAILVPVGFKYNWWLSATLKDYAVGGALLVVLNLVLMTIDRLLMRPIVRDLPRTADGVGLLDRLQSLGRTMSTTWLAFYVIFFLATGAGNLFIAVAQGKPIYLLFASPLIFFAGAYGYALAQKLRARSTADAGEH